MFDVLASLVAEKGELQQKIDAAIARLPMIDTPDMPPPELCRYRGHTPEGLVTKIAPGVGLCYDVWHDGRYYGRFIFEHAQTVLHLVTMGNCYA